MQSSEINKILREYKDVFEALEKYDKTQELPFQRKRIDITLSVFSRSRMSATLNAALLGI